MCVRGVEVYNLGDGDTGFLFCDEVDFVPLPDLSFSQHREVKPGAFASEETFHDVAATKSDPKLVARHPRLRDDELG